MTEVSTYSILAMQPPFADEVCDIQFKSLEKGKVTLSFFFGQGGAN